MNPSTTGDGSNEPSKASITDSPLFWLPIFLVGALVALVLSGPKYSWRQPQIERQFQAREAAGHAVPASSGFTELSTEGNAVLSLRPLLLFFTLTLLVATVAFWMRRFVRAKANGVLPSVSSTRNGDPP